MFLVAIVREFLYTATQNIVEYCQEYIRDKSVQLRTSRV